MSRLSWLQLAFEFLNETPADAMKEPHGTPSLLLGVAGGDSAQQTTHVATIQESHDRVKVTSDRPGHPAGRTERRKRAAAMHSKLLTMGLREVDAVVLVRTRSVMVSFSRRTLRVHEGYADAPERVLAAIVSFACARTRAERKAACRIILAHEVDRFPAVRRREPTRAGDSLTLAQLREAHAQLNRSWFDSALKPIDLRLSGRMATRLGHFDPGSTHAAPEIVLSRRHVRRDVWAEVIHTLLHEMVHQWQHETGRPVDHGREFRARARQLGITPAARREVRAHRGVQRLSWAG